MCPYRARFFVDVYYQALVDERDQGRCMFRLFEIAVSMVLGDVAGKIGMGERRRAAQAQIKAIEIAMTAISQIR